MAENSAAEILIYFSMIKINFFDSEPNANIFTDPILANRHVQATIGSTILFARSISFLSLHFTACKVSGGHGAKYRKLRKGGNN